jgi:heme iron utilization protein
MDVQSEKLLAHLIRNTRIASLGTVRDETPHVSMVSFVTADDFSGFYIHTSRLAQHAMDMQKDKHVSLLVVENDDGRADPQTFARITIRGSAVLMENGEPGYNLIKTLYIERFPDTEALFKLGDFGLWRIKPKGGRFIMSLTKAYNITPDALHKVSER